MHELEYCRLSWKTLRVEEDENKGKHLIAQTRYSGETIDYSDEDNLSAFIFNSRKNANDLFNLVMEKYTGKDPADIQGFEMLVALINLSSELYLKCLIYYYHQNQGKQIKGLHNLKAYFTKLPEAIQVEIKEISPDFDAQLNDISNYFNEFRYSSEYNIIKSISFAFDFAKKLKQVCNSLKIQRPTELIYSKNRLMVKHGEKTVWDSKKNKEYQYPIISKDD